MVALALVAAVQVDELDLHVVDRIGLRGAGGAHQRGEAQRARKGEGGQSSDGHRVPRGLSVSGRSSDRLEEQTAGPPCAVLRAFR